MIKIYRKEKTDLVIKFMHFDDCINNKSRQWQSYKTSVTLFIYIFSVLASHSKHK